MQTFQESILAPNSFSLPVSLMPASFFSQTLPVVTGPRRLEAATQYNAAVSRGSFGVPVAFKDPFLVSQFVFPGQCFGTENSHQLGWFQRGWGEVGIL